MKKNLLLCLFFSSICFRALAQCDCPATPTNIQYVPGFNSGAPLQIDLNGSQQSDVAWDVAPVDEDGNGTTDWLVVVGSTVYQATHGKDAFALRVNLDGSTGWYYHVDFPDHKDEEAHAVFVTSDKKILLCGTARTTYKHPNNTYLSDDVWVQKLTLGGAPVTAWSSNGLGQFYGSFAISQTVKNPDKGFDIAEDLNGNYAVVGQGWAKYGDIGDAVQSNGDIWVLKLKANDGTLLDNAIWFSTTNATSTGSDHAEGIAIDCNTGHYVVSTFCGSCESPAMFTLTDVMLLDYNPSDLHASGYPQTYPYGTSGYDQNSFDIIQSFDKTYGTCSSGDGFVSNGIIHECFSASHNFYSIKTQNNLSPSTFIVNCPGNNGVARGGAQTDNGHSVIQALDGYLLAGTTYSDALDNNPNGEVSCNHYTCGTPFSDFWLAHLNRCTGELDWNESIGTNDNEECYSIKRLSDNSYVMVGYTDNYHTLLQTDLYIVRFTITQCNSPVNLTAGNTGLTLDFDWDGSKCNPYHFQYKRNNGTYGNDMYLTTSEAHPTVTQCGIYTGRVQTQCSSTLSSSWVYATVTISSGCKIENEEKLADGIFSVSPNPSSGVFEIFLQHKDLFNGYATIEVLDNTGRVVTSEQQQMLNGELRLTKSISLPSGFYIVRIKEEGMAYQAILLIQNN